MVLEPPDSWLLHLLLSSSKGRLIEQRIRYEKLIETHSICAVGMIYLAVDLTFLSGFAQNEARDTRLLPSRFRGTAFRQQLFLGGEVIIHRSFAVVAGGVEVVVEVLAVGRVPRELPAHALLEGIDLLDGRSADEDEIRVARPEMRGVREVVGHVAAAVAAGVVGRVEHEVLDEKLTAAVEQVGERSGAAVRRGEVVGLGDRVYWHLAAFLGQGGLGAGHVFLLLEERLPRSKPFFRGGDLHDGNALSKGRLLLITLNEYGSDGLEGHDTRGCIYTIAERLQETIDKHRQLISTGGQNWSLEGINIERAAATANSKSA